MVQKTNTKNGTNDLIPSSGSLQAPYSQEAEEATIGAILVNPVAYFAVAAFLKADDFFILRHRYVWEALEALNSRNEPIDYLTVTQELKNQHRLTEIGGAAYLTQLINSTPTSVHAAVYGKLVLSFATRRRLMAAADEIRALALNSTIDTDEVLSKSASTLGEVMYGADIEPLSRIVKHVAIVADDLAERRTSGRTVLGIPTGWPTFDKVTGGLCKEEFMIIGGSPGMGKTHTLLALTLAVARQMNTDTNKPNKVLFITFEMYPERLARRLIAAQSGVSLQLIKTGAMSEPEYGVAKTGMEKLSQYDIVIDSPPEHLMTVEHCERRIQEFGYTFGALPEVVVIDYVQLLQEQNNGRYRMPRNEFVKWAAYALRGFGRRYKLHIMAAAQLNRMVNNRDDKRPELSDLGESGGLERAADIVMFPFRPVEGRKEYELIIRKNRDGKPTTIDMWADPATLQYQERKA